MCIQTKSKDHDILRSTILTHFPVRLGFKGMSDNILNFENILNKTKGINY